MKEEIEAMGAKLMQESLRTYSAEGSDKVLKSVKKFLDLVGYECDNDTYICGVKTPAVPKVFGMITIHKDADDKFRYYVHAAA